MNETSRPESGPLGRSPVARIAEAPAGNRLAMSWLDVAFELEQQNAELRRIATALFIWILEHEDLAAYARAQIGARWPERKAA
jgi:hypothetical protein